MTIPPIPIPPFRYTPYEHFPPPLPLAIYIFNPLRTGLLFRSTFSSPPRPALAPPFASWDIEHQKEGYQSKKLSPSPAFAAAYASPSFDPLVSPRSCRPIYIPHSLFLFSPSFIYPRFGHTLHLHRIKLPEHLLTALASSSRGNLRSGS